MAHVQRKRTGNTFWAMVGLGLIVVAALIVWAMTSGRGPDVQRLNPARIEVPLPDAPKLPSAPNPDPLPSPTPPR